MPLYVASRQFISITNNLTYILILIKFNFNFSKTILLHIHVPFSLSFVCLCFSLLSLELGRCSSDLFLSSRPRTGLATTCIIGYG